MRHIRAIVLDIDGILTDGSFWWGPNGEEFKRFAASDVTGISLALKAGLLVTLICTDDSPLVERYARKIGVTDIVTGCTDKTAAVRAFAERNGIDLGDICFVGHEINDVAAMAVVGLAAAPSNAQPVAKHWASFVSHFPAGNGAVRQIVESILSSKKAVRTMRSA
jgi:3-deoxy-D-manno-octulosonate 8-phosphate phosphatase (KDO 8-P phosphatase)